MTEFDSVRKCCRYEIFIPLNYNDGSLVEPRKILETTEEIMNKFNGLTTYPVSLRASGLWRDGDNIFSDELMVYRMDVGQDLETLTFFVEYKQKLKKDYKQIEIYITRQKMEII